jgi:mannose-1-phosphate guanylyltransferase/mannose-1-phosphate guanylyltransferase/mannose-6-phosphate isomerase
MSEARPITPVILSGGSGMRLWPLSRLGRPKQFLALTGALSLLEETALRVSGEGFERPILVGAAGQEEALGRIDAALTILEPAPRNTAPAVALAALAAPDALLLVLPSDHVVADPALFREAVEAARPAAEAGWLVTFGMAPDRPETGYGYISTGEPVAGAARRAAAFVEKPDRATAESYLGEGGWLWNSGMFLMRADAFLAALRTHAPDIAAAAEASLRRDGDRIVADPDAFARAPSRSIDRAVMEVHDRVAVLPASFGWSDIGSWEALHGVSAKDGDGNVLIGDVVAVDAKGSLIRSEGPVIAAIGVEDLIVVATERAVLIVPRAQSQRVDEAIAALNRRRD